MTRQPHGLPPRSCTRVAPWGERGSASIQMVILMPAMFAVMFLGMQAALIYHARTLAIASAQEGAGRIDDGVYDRRTAHELRVRRVGHVSKPGLARIQSA